MPARKRTASKRRTAPRKTVRTEIKQIRAAEMRRHPTKAEAHLWAALRAADLGLYLTRQKLLHGWIADIYCAAARTLIEVDGPSHLARRGADAFRDRTLAGKGYLTLRYTNEQVFRETARVVAHIRAQLYRRVGWA